MKKRLLVMAGGTGGHVFPGLAVAHYLISQGWDVRWLGTKDRMESDLVPKQGIPIDFIQISGLRGKGVIALCLAPIRIIRAVWQANKLIRRYQPNVVLGMGGYVSGPGGVAAWLAGIPIVLHEQNGIAGLTNRLLAKIAACVLQAFPTAFKHAEIVGNPVRDNIIAVKLPQKRFTEREGNLRILVLGGSQGAKILNDTLPKATSLVSSKIEIWHQTGKGVAKSVHESYVNKGIKPYKVVEFIEDIAAAYDWADIIICRSGALTVSEISAVGLPAIFIPFMHKDRQQYWNALPLQEIGAAYIIEQPVLSAQKIADILQGLDRKKLLEMANAAKSIGILDSTQRVAEVVSQCAR